MLLPIGGEGATDDTYACESIVRGVPRKRRYFEKEQREDEERREGKSRAQLTRMWHFAIHATRKKYTRQPDENIDPAVPREENREKEGEKKVQLSRVQSNGKFRGAHNG